MGKAVLDSFYNPIIETAWANCFASLFAPVSPVIQNGTHFYLLPNGGVSKARFVLAKRLGTPGKAMPRKGKGLFGLDSRVPDTSAVVFRLLAVVTPFKNMQKPARPPIKYSHLIIHNV